MATTRQRQAQQEERRKATRRASHVPQAAAACRLPFGGQWQGSAVCLIATAHGESGEGRTTRLSARGRASGVSTAPQAFRVGPTLRKLCAALWVGKRCSRQAPVERNSPGTLSSTAEEGASAAKTR